MRSVRMVRFRMREAVAAAWVMTVGVVALGVLASGGPAAAPGPTRAVFPVRSATGGWQMRGRAARVVRPRPAVAPSGLAARTAAVVAAWDSTGWDWRAAGVAVHVGYHPRACCHWGVFDMTDSTVWVGPDAFASRERVRYVALHELAHAWQWRSGHLGVLAADLGRWGRNGADAFEAGADCVARRWGATLGHYWSCPAAAEALMGRRLAGSWSP
jgi:hypothetical protein